MSTDGSAPGRQESNDEPRISLGAAGSASGGEYRFTGDPNRDTDAAAPTGGSPPAAPAAPQQEWPGVAPTGSWTPPGRTSEGPGFWAPPASFWSPAGQPARTITISRSRAIGAGLAAAALVAGVGIGYAVGSPDSSSGTAAPASSGSGANPPAGADQVPGLDPSGPESGSPGGGTSGAQSPGGSTSNARGGPQNVSAIATKVTPGLVDINTTIDYGSAKAAGTGMVLTSSGEVLTNNHVVNGATTISVTDLANGNTYSASVVGYDRSHDVAVIQLKDASGLQTVDLGDSSSVAVGQAVVGIGNAGGVGGTPSAAGGAVTALNQSITANDEGGGTSEQLTGLIETNADIQAGDSGGPLVNVDGKVIGIDTAGSVASDGSSTGQGYAVPINTAIAIARQIESGSGSSTIHLGQTAFLGVEVQPSPQSASNGFGGFGGGGYGYSFGPGSDPTTPSAQGVAVQGTVSGSPAESAGLGQGDTITSVAGKAVNDPQDLTSVLGRYHPGDKVSIEWTDGQGLLQSATVTLANGPAA